MIELLAKYKYKVDWVNNEDWTVANSDYVAFEENYEGLSTAFFLQWGLGVVSKNILEKNKKYRVTFKVIRRKSGVAGGYKLTVGDAEQNVINVVDGKEYTVVMASGNSTKFQLEKLSLSDYFGITEVSIEELLPISLDLFDDINILLTLGISEIRNPDKRIGSYSKNFDISGSHINNRFFKYVFKINADCNFNINAKTNIKITSDNGGVLLEGFLKLNNVKIIDDEYIYNVQIYGGNAELFVAFGDDLLSDLDWSAYDHTASAALVEDTWLNYITYGYVYPYIDYGQGAFHGTVGAIDDVTVSPTLSNVGLTVSDLYPSFSVKTIIDNVIDHYGFNHEGLFENVIFNKLIIPFSGKEEKLNDWRSVAQYTNSSLANYGKNKVAYANSTPTVGAVCILPDCEYVYLGSGGGRSYNGYADGCIPVNTSIDYPSVADGVMSHGWTKDWDYYERFNNSNVDSVIQRDLTISGTEEQGPQYNNNIIPGTYLVRKAGKYKIKTGHKILTLESSAEIVYLVAFKISRHNLEFGNDVGDFYFLNTADDEETHIKQTYTYNISNHGYTEYEQSFDCVEGDLIGWKVVSNIASNDVSGAFVGRFSWVSIEENLWGRDADVKGNDFIPENYKVKDFFKDLLLMYNVYVDVDKTDPSKLNIETRRSYYADGGSHNWTDKLHNDKEVKLIHPQDLQKKRINLRYSEASDYWNDYYNTKLDPLEVGYGGVRKIYENEFIDGEETIGLTLKSSVLRGVDRMAGIGGRTAAIITQYVDKSYDPDTVFGWDYSTEIGNRILFYAPTQFNQTSASYKFRFENDEDAFKYSGKYWYPYAGHILGVFDQENAGDLNFKTSISDVKTGVWQGMFPLFPAYTITDNNLYNLYWKDYFEEISDKDARVLQAKFNLTDNDIATLSMADTIQIDNTNYTINKIKDYIPGGDVPTTVELLKRSDLTIDYVTGTTENITVGSGVSLLVPRTPSKSITLGKDNYVKDLDASVIVAGKGNIATGTEGIVIGDNNIISKGNVIGGSNNKINSNVTVIGSDNVIVDSGVTKVTLINTSYTKISASDSGTTYISGVKIKSGTILPSQGINRPGIDTVQTDFTNGGINHPGENKVYDPTYIDSDIVNRPK